MFGYIQANTTDLTEEEKRAMGQLESSSANVCCLTDENPEGEK